LEIARMNVTPTTTFLAPVERVLERLDGVKRSGSGWTAKCPAHSDETPSLSVREGDDHRVLLRCFSGCSFGQIMAALGLPERVAFADEQPQPRPSPQPNGHQRRIVETHPYLDESNSLLFEVVRFSPKGFSQRRPDGHGGWVWNLDGVRRVPFHLPELIALVDDPTPILWCEGERDVLTAEAMGFVATTSPQGAAAFKPEIITGVADHLFGRPVVVIPDNDEPGRRYAEQVAQALREIGCPVSWLGLPGTSEKGGDLSDWVAGGGSPDALADLVVRAPAWEPPPTMFAGPAQGEPREPTPARPLRAPAGVLARDVTPERVVWLSPGRLARGKASVLDGDPELGKSTLSLEWAARITRGDALPGGEPGSPRGVVILSAEDGIADTIVPRLIAAGADLDCVFIMTGIRTSDGGEDTVTVPGGLDAVESAIVEMGASMLIVDPLVAFLGADTNSNRDQDVRRAMAPLAALLDRTGCAGLLLRHLTKAAGGPALYRGGGSIGIIGAARIGLLAARDPDDDEARILAPVKCNLGPHPPALRYRLVGVPGAAVARISWDDAPVTINANGLLAAAMGSDEDRTALDEAVDWLRDLLALGPKPAADVLKEARRDGVAEITVRRAKSRLGVHVRREGFGPGSHVVWFLADRPPYDPDDVAPIDDHRSTDDHPSSNDHLWRNPRNGAENNPTIDVRFSIHDHQKSMIMYGADDHLWSHNPQTDQPRGTAGDDQWTSA
jgi:hypothetical protein